MADRLRIVLFDQAPSPDDPLRAAFDAADGVEVVDEVGDWEQLQTCLSSGAADCVAVNLDGAGDGGGLRSVQAIGEVAPDRPVIGVSRSAEAQTIIAAMRAGCSQFVSRPIDPSDLREALASIRQVARPGSLESRRTCVVGAAGGTGATTIACNLALALAHATDRTCGLVDLHLEFGDVACAFDVQPKYTIADACRDGVELDRMLLEQVLHELPSNVHVLARPDRVDDAREVTPEGVEHALRLMGQMYPNVVVDVPRTGHVYAGAAFNGATRVLIVAQLSVPVLRNATRLFEGLASAGVAESAIEIVLNRCNANYERITPDEVEQHFGKPVFATIPNDYRRVAASTDLGHPIVNDTSRSPARRAIQEMAHKLAAGPAPVDGEGGGLLSKFLGRSPAAGA